MTDSLPSARSPWPEWAAVLLVVLVAALPRLVFLDADPSPSLQAILIADEGGWAHNARSRVLFDAWATDEQTPGIYATPLFSAALAGVYAIAGVGTAETRLLAAWSGILTCLVLYGALRLRMPAREALPPALALALGYFTIAQNRVGLPESFQLLLATGAAVAVYLAAERPGWAVLGGVLFVAAQLAKPSALILGPMAVAFWLAHWFLARQGVLAQPFRWRTPLLWAAGAAGAGAVVLVALILPNWDGFATEMQTNLSAVYVTTERPRVGLVMFFGIKVLGLSADNGFWRDAAVGILVSVLVMAGRLAGQGRRRMADPVELLAWTWLLLGLAFQTTQAVQPGRRFLLLMPALALFLGQAWNERGVGLPSGATVPALWRRVLVGGLLGGTAGLYLAQGLQAPVMRVAAALGRELSYAGALTLIWSGTFVAAIGLASLGWRWLPRRQLVLGPAVLAGLFLAWEPGRMAWHLSQRTYTRRAISEELAQLTAGWAPKDRVVATLNAHSLELDADWFSFPVRSRYPGGPAINGHGIARLRPGLVLINRGVNQRVQSLSPLMGEGDYVQVREFLHSPGLDGEPRWRVRAYVRRDLCGECTGP